MICIWLEKSKWKIKAVSRENNNRPPAAIRVWYPTIIIRGNNISTEIAGITTREMVNVIRGLSGLDLISVDVVEVSPAYDHAEVTSLAAATIVYELTNLFAKK